MPALRRSHLLRCPERSVWCSTTRYTASKLKVHLDKQHRMNLPDGRAKNHPDYELSNAELVEKYQPTDEEFKAIQDDERRKEIQLSIDRQTIKEREDSGDLGWGPLGNPVNCGRVTKNKSRRNKTPKPAHRQAGNEAKAAQRNVPADAEVIDLTSGSQSSEAEAAFLVTENGLQFGSTIIEVPETDGPVILTDEDINTLRRTLRVSRRRRVAITEPTASEPGVDAGDQPGNAPLALPEPADASPSTMTADQEEEVESSDESMTDVDSVPRMVLMEEDKPWILPRWVLSTWEQAHRDQATA